MKASVFSYAAGNPRDIIKLDDSIQGWLDNLGSRIHDVKIVDVIDTARAHMITSMEPPPIIRTVIVLYEEEKPFNSELWRIEVILVPQQVVVGSRIDKKLDDFIVEIQPSFFSLPTPFCFFIYCKTASF